MWLRSLFVFWLFALLAAAGCTVAPRGVVGEQCEKNSECDVPLVCRLGHCRNECRTSADCVAPAICLLDNRKLGACRLPAEETCALASDCPSPLVCRMRREVSECVNECATERDCLAGAACIDGSCDEMSGRPCVRDGECEVGVEACIAGRCRPECRQDRDCRNGFACELAGEFGRCVGRPGVDAGMDATVDAAPDAAVPRCGEAMAAPLAVDSIIDTGDDHTCAVARLPGATAQSVVCWGPLNEILGSGGTAAPAGCPVVVVGIDGDQVVDLAVAGVHACALMASGEVFCWGQNSLGELGLGSAAPNTPTPTMVPGVTGALAIAANYSHTCVTRAPSNALCWGLNSAANDQLGNGGVAGDSPLPSTAVPMANIVGIGMNFTCMANDFSPQTCFGQASNNRTGMMGFGTMAAGGGPVAGGTNHGCAIDAVGRLFCWGLNDTGQVGVPGADGLTRVEVTVPVGTTATDIALGDTHSCVLLSDTTVRCWGSNANRQVQPGGGLFFDAPVEPIAGLTSVVGITAGWRHTCAVTMDGRVHCWGDNPSGQLGDGTTTPTTTPMTSTTVLTP